MKPIRAMWMRQAALSYALALVNPNAETGDITGWSNVISTFTAGAGPSGRGGVAHSGTWFFYAGNTAQSMMAQTVAIQSILWPDIDADKVTLTLNFWDMQTDSDRGSLSITWLDGSGATIGCNVSPYIARNNEPTWANDTLTLKAPAGARSVRLYYDSKRTTGTSNDAYIDDISGVFSVATPTTVELPIINTDASTGSLTGWTIVSGTPSTLTNSSGVIPRISTNFFYAGTTATPSMRQTLTVPSTAVTSVDAGTATLNWSYMQSCIGGDQHRNSVEFYASNGTTLLGSSTPAFTSNASGDWTNVSQSVAVPAGTRFVRLLCQWNRVAGTSNDGYAHCFRAWITL